MPSERRPRPNPNELVHAWTREDRGLFRPTPHRAVERKREERRLQEELQAELQEERHEPTLAADETPRFPEAKRRHEAELTRQEMALEDLHEARRRESRDPGVRRREAQAADRHAREARRHQEQGIKVAEAAVAAGDLRSLTISSKRPVGTLQVLLPIGLGASVLLVLAGLLGVAVFGAAAATTVAIGLLLGIVVNGALMFSLLSSLRATDERVRQLAEIEAARHARQVEHSMEQRNARRTPTVRNEVRMHRVEVRPEKGRVTTEDDVFRSEQTRE